MDTICRIRQVRFAQSPQNQPATNVVDSHHLHQAGLQPLATDIFFSGKTKEQKLAHNRNEKKSREKRNKERVDMEKQCRELGIDLDTLMPPMKTLPPSNSKLTEKERKERHNLVGKYGRDRKKQYFQNLQAALRNATLETSSPAPHEAKSMTGPLATSPEPDHSFEWNVDDFTAEGLKTPRTPVLVAGSVPHSPAWFPLRSGLQSPNPFSFLENESPIGHQEVEPEFTQPDFADELFSQYFDLDGEKTLKSGPPLN